jgi:NhaP-type Na+/H+ or K+/H+ antiporter
MFLRWTCAQTERGTITLRGSLPVDVPAVVILVGLLVFLAHALEDVFLRTKVPDVLLLLVLGLLLGPMFHLVDPGSFGRVGPIFTTITLVVILFESGLGLDLRLLVKSLAGATFLTLGNFAVTLLVVPPIAHFTLGLGWMGSFTLGAILGGTSSAVVIPLVKRLTLAESTRTLLSLESALSDVVVIVVSLGLMQAQLGPGLRLGAMLGSMAAVFLLAALLGCACGFLWSMALNRVHGLQNSILTTPAFVLVVYGLTELAGYSGAIAALVAGITLGNLERLQPLLPGRWFAPFDVLTATERTVFSELVFLLKTFFFVYVGISLSIRGWQGPLAGLLMTAVLYLARIPLVRRVVPASPGSRDDWTCAFMNPKGLAAAVVATLPAQMGLPGGEILRSTAFSVVLFSIVLTSVLIFLFERTNAGGPGKVRPNPEGVSKKIGTS